MLYLKMRLSFGKLVTCWVETILERNLIILNGLIKLFLKVIIITKMMSEMH